MTGWNRSRFTITCCTPDCPKRIPGCGDHCEEYAKQKAAHQKQKEVYDGISSLRQYVAEQNAKYKDHTAKKRKKSYGRKPSCD